MASCCLTLSNYNHDVALMQNLYDNDFVNYHEKGLGEKILDTP